MNPSEQEILILNQIRQRVDPVAREVFAIMRKNGLIVTETLQKELNLDLVNTLWAYFNTEGKTYSDALEHLEELKKDKEPQYIENLSKQQQDIITAFNNTEQELVFNTIHKWETINFGVK